MSTYRTLSERPELFRTPRSRKEAGIVGSLDTKIPAAEFVDLLKAELEREQKPPGGWPLLVFWVAVVCLAGWAGITLLFRFGGGS